MTGEPPVDPFDEQMRKLAGDDARRAEQLRQIAESVRQHCALLDTTVLAMYVGSALARLAERAGVTPTVVVEQLVKRGAIEPADWPKTERALKNLERVTRQRYVGAGVSFFERDHSSN